MRRRRFTSISLAAALLSGLLLPAAARATPAAAAVTGSSLLAAGDVGSCSNTAGATATAALIGAHSGLVGMLGDANGPDNSLAQYQQCYGPTWGKYLSRTRPTAGNRDLAGTSPGYYAYFGGAAGPAGKGYYSYTLGTWHIVVLNSNCSLVGGCTPTSAQGQWLSADLAAHPNTCTLAYWHWPVFTSGSATPGSTAMLPLFQILYNHHADVVLNGENENYERFAPQNPQGVADPNGIREFVVGTGGEGHEGFGTIAPNSQVRNSTTFGILHMTLGAGQYSWQFLPVAGQTFTDSGTGTCHSAQPQSATMYAAGDIPTCSNGSPNPNAAATAALIGPTGTVAPLGDLIAENGVPADFVNCYGPTWGKYKSRSRPTVGNHEDTGAVATAYYAYFGALAGPPGKGYYSYDLGTWHIVVLNANCADVPGGCGTGSPQEMWLRADLAAHPAHCILAYWHEPLFTSGAVHSGYTTIRPFWQDLYNAGAEIVLNGHNHQYERFAPQTPTGAADPAHGIREFVVGTGGVSHYPFGTIQPNSEVRNDTTYGVLKLTLNPGSYSWKFLPVAGQTFTDSGTGTCH
jgi:Calcineurin-like phosphoesterase